MTTTAFLDDFAAAWNRHDVDAILSMMTADCVFESSRGADVAGTRYIGQAEVRRGVEEALAAFPDARWRDPRHFIAGDRGVTEWVFSGTSADGMRTEVQGCDVFTFRDGKIAIKNSYRKQRVQLEQLADNASLPLRGKHVRDRSGSESQPLKTLIKKQLAETESVKHTFN